MMMRELTLCGMLIMAMCIPPDETAKDWTPEQKQQWLREACRLGEERKKMLFADENTSSLMLDEGLYVFAADVAKVRPWHTLVSEEYARLKTTEKP